MKKIKLITVLEYAALSKNDKAIYDMVLETISPVGKSIRVKHSKHFTKVAPRHEDLWDFSFADIIDIKAAAGKKGEELTREICRIVYRSWLDRVCVLDLPVFNWILHDLSELIETEKAELDYEPSEEEKAAGIDDLNRFGYIPIIKSLTGGDMTKEKEILEKPYHEIFTELAYQKTMSEIKTRLYAGK